MTVAAAATAAAHNTAIFYSNHLLNIINDILDVAALKEGKLTIKHEAVNLSKAVEHVCDIVSPLAKKEVRAHVCVCLCVCARACAPQGGMPWCIAIVVLPRVEKEAHGLFCRTQTLRVMTFQYRGWCEMCDHCTPIPYPPPLPTHAHTCPNLGFQGGAFVPVRRAPRCVWILVRGMCCGGRGEGEHACPMQSFGHDMA
eukprot:1156313-Pelagomonas_calceolata.AAC.4